MKIHLMILFLMTFFLTICQAKLIEEDELAVGKRGSSANKIFKAFTSASNKPHLRYNVSGTKWQGSDDGTTFYDLGFSFNSQGNPAIKSSATLVPGTGISFMQSGSNITITATASATVTAWADDTANFSIGSRFGTGATISAFSRRVADTLEFRGKITCGSSASATATDGYVSLVGYNLDTSKMYTGANVSPLGFAFFSPPTDSTTPIGSNNRTHGVYYDGTNDDRFFMTLFMTNAAFQQSSADGICSAQTGTVIMFMGSAPVTQFN